MPRVVDTSVVVKWTVQESGSEAARTLIGEELIAPDLLSAELAHVLSKRSRAGEFGALQALASQALIEEAVALVSTAPFSGRALELSLELGHPAGDCFFLALAEATDMEFVTADVRFAVRCSGTRYARQVRLLEGDGVP